MPMRQGQAGVSLAGGTTVGASGGFGIHLRGPVRRLRSARRDSPTADLVLASRKLLVADSLRERNLAACAVARQAVPNFICQGVDHERAADIGPLPAGRRAGPR